MGSNPVPSDGSLPSASTSLLHRSHGTKPHRPRLSSASLAKEASLHMKPDLITRADLLTLIEDVSFGKAVVGGADRDGVVVDGYLDLRRISEGLNRLIEIRNQRRTLIDHEQAR